MAIKTEVRKDVYFDSVTLMIASSKMREVPGVRDAAVMMGTDRNKDLMNASHLIDADTPVFTANDTVLGILADDDAAIEAAMKALNDYFTKKISARSGNARAKSLNGAKRMQPGLNFTVISLPGRYAKAEAEKALDMGLHVLLFSDNVTLEDEISLKEKALERGLLMMGPDCGTAIVNGSALGFANAVRGGNIGLAAAAGTGLQEVAVLIDRLGGGVSQALGTGGRDLKEPVGGMMMSLCLDALENDQETEVIVIISKPPHPSVMGRIADKIKAFSKPVVACLLGGDPKTLEGTGAIYAEDLESAARVAVKLSRGAVRKDHEITAEELSAIAGREASLFSQEQLYLRGLYSGGTLCYEAMLAMERAGIPVYSNIAVNKDFALPDVEASKENTLLDMGDDYFTNGLPHPMIDPRLRVERIEREAGDPAAAVLLLDCVGGYGSHENPAGALAPAIKAAMGNADAQGRHLSVIASVCGTEQDPQRRGEQEEILRSAGAIVMPCNAQASRLAVEIMRQAAARRG
jgi:succinyl-CoA synthetase alpha subunit